MSVQLCLWRRLPLSCPRPFVFSSVPYSEPIICYLLQRSQPTLLGCLSILSSVSLSLGLHFLVLICSPTSSAELTSRGQEFVSFFTTYDPCLLCNHLLSVSVSHHHPSEQMHFESLNLPKIISTVCFFPWFWEKKSKMTTYK